MAKSLSEEAVGRLIKRKNIKDSLKLIKGSKTDYITPTGLVYRRYDEYGKDLFYPKKIIVNKTNGYGYAKISYPNSKSKLKRVNILVAQAFIPNPNNYPIVLHLDNNKLNNNVTNLKWGTYSENTLQAYRDGLCKNDKGFEDSQSQAVIMYDTFTRKPIKIFGSCRECARKTNYPLATILFQCKEYRNVKNSVYFRFLKDGDIKPPRLVIQYDYNTDKIINKFYDSGNASEETNISPSTISHQCSKRNKPQRKPKSGYYFMYG